jgi:hypothetical protein
MASELPEERNESEAGERLIARRVLLRRALYISPAVLGTFIVTRSAAAASCSPGVCQPPSGCNPIGACNPPRNPCVPAFNAFQAGAMTQMAQEEQRRRHSGR